MKKLKLSCYLGHNSLKSFTKLWTIQEKKMSVSKNIQNFTDLQKFFFKLLTGNRQAECKQGLQLTETIVQNGLLYSQGNHVSPSNNFNNIKLFQVKEQKQKMLSETKGHNSQKTCNKLVKNTLLILENHKMACYNLKADMSI